MNDRPPISELNHISVMDDHAKPWIEVSMTVKQRVGQPELLTAEFFPNGRPLSLQSPKVIQEAPVNEPCVRLLQPDVVNDENRERYKTFAAAAGRLAYRGEL